MKITVSFSGGRSSAVMTKLVHEKYANTHDISVVFANTGGEHPATLDFVDECDRKFGWGVVWVEAVINEAHGDGIGFNVVNYETAARNWEPFEAAVKKYGIFNQVAKSCTTKLKEIPMTRYRESIGMLRGKNLNYDTAIGIRCDEIDRMAGKEVRERERLIYPLVSAGFTKRDVAIEIKGWGFDLGIPGDHFGNCLTCYKKSNRKLMTVAKQSPESFDFFERMEREQETHKAGPEYKCARDGVRRWFRGWKTVADIKADAAGDFREYVDDPFEHAHDWSEVEPLNDLDIGGSCGDSCEAFVGDGNEDAVFVDLELQSTQ
jgi:hypothetical protein